MRMFVMSLAGLLASFSAMASDHGDELSYTERMALYADWSTFFLLIVALVALIRFWNK
ncbi:MAG: hypothetical protein HN377_05585 [Alphaproteobacteria bacterium]|jgi:hypothetical protein|nr:hypothetical protein [Alphaproteobacteria bacterium]